MKLNLEVFKFYFNFKILFNQQEFRNLFLIFLSFFKIELLK